MKGLPRKGLSGAKNFKINNRMLVFTEEVRSNE